ncbi:MAG: A/G-specific adenine glycosylase [Zoogloeaceae bacterium]|jgi:A/G-specific adenine glycosylase|nr:A/G-specific adenine glycosylase [Zoogloeaceae bacterium]
MKTAFASRIVRWQRLYGRHDLPWQAGCDPYPLWLSEIMLQQTQVTTALGYFSRFMARFPDVRSLAAASLDEVLSLWAGLGYYARARNLHASARKVATELGGRFPETAAGLVELPGIGRSTAAAIAVFAYGERAAILDGNVKRVLCRYFAIEGVPTGQREKDLWTLAESLLPTAADMRAYTQGLMDLGATRCVRKNPRCADCPLAEDCLARQQGRVETLPTPRARTEKPRRSAIFLLITDGEHILLQRRPPVGVWGGLFCLPEGLALLRQFGLSDCVCRDLPPREHVFTHFRLEIRPVLCRIAKMPVFAGESGLECLSLQEAARAGIPAPVARLLGELEGQEPDSDGRSG